MNIIRTRFWNETNVTCADSGVVEDAATNLSASLTVVHTLFNPRTYAKEGKQEWQVIT